MMAALCGEIADTKLATIHVQVAKKITNKNCPIIIYWQFGKTASTSTIICYQLTVYSALFWRFCCKIVTGGF